jgi:hypothetical protein
MLRNRSDDTTTTVLTHVQALLREMDLRYQQRFDAQQQALDAALLAQEKSVQTAMIASEKAIVKSEVAAEKRFDGVNEFRQLVTDLVREQMPRIEAEQRMASMAEKVEELRNTVTASAGRGQGLQAGWGYLLGVLLLLTSVAAVVLGLRT